jgi:ABC-type dipeptide/oligopeptide/nickel transport system permease component
MWNYIQRQLLLGVPVLLGVSVLVFVMLSYIPGQAPEILALQAGGTGLTADEMAALRERLGLNDPLPVQYFRFLGNAVQGDLGRSMRSNRQVVDILVDAFPRTLELATAGMLLAVALGLSLGTLAAVFRGTWVDASTMVVALAGWSMPSFWLGLVLLLVFALQLGWFPITGQGGLQRLVLPAVTLGLADAGLVARLVRAEIVEQMGRDYVTTARAKGLHARAVILRHVLKNSLISVVTVVGLQFGRLLGGTVIIENVFARQGVGRVAVDALLARDMAVLQGCVLFLAIVFVLTNLAVDLLYGVVDPRVRMGARA